jgi:hypothetical protein
MDMSIAILFFAAFTVMLVTAALMDALSRKFMTHRVVDRPFDILDLQFPVDAKELRLVINGIYRLTAEETKKSARALKAQLIVDYFFMPAAYGTVALLCYAAARHLPLWSEFYLALAWAQLLAWICDIGENIYLFSRIHPYAERDQIKRYRLYQFFVYTKWLTVLIGVVCAFAAFAFLLFAGSFPTIWYIYLAGVVILLIVYALLTRRRVKTGITPT